MKNIVSQLSEMKHYVAAGGILIAFLFDRKLGPSEDDLPMRFKIILAAPVIVASYYAHALTAEQRPQQLPYAFALFMLSMLAYVGIWSLFGYTKVFITPRSWWKLWKPLYRIQRVMGGNLTNEAKSKIASENISPQDLFEGREYKQDQVWTRSSRALLQMTLVLTYISTALFYTLTIAIPLA